jgi:hypothetical protein
MEATKADTARVVIGFSPSSASPPSPTAAFARSAPSRSMLSFVLTLPPVEAAKLCRPQALQPMEYSDDDEFLTDDEEMMQGEDCDCMGSDDSECFALCDLPSSEPIPIPTARWAGGPPRAHLLRAPRAPRSDAALPRRRRRGYSKHMGMPQPRPQQAAQP